MPMPPRPMPAAFAARSSQRPRRWGWIALAALAALALTLAASFPARVAARWAGVPLPAQAISGTVWNGVVTLPGGHGARWRWSPARSLIELAFAADVTITGPETELAANAVARPGGVTLTNVRGLAAWPLVAALAPRLPFVCDFTMRVALGRVMIAGAASGASGEVRSEPGLCGVRGGPSARVPGLVAVATGATASVAPRLQRWKRLAQARVSPEGVLSVRALPAARSMLPPGALTADAVEVRL